VAYSVEISRIYLDTKVAIYAWEMTTGPAGHVTLDRDSETIRPCDAAGRPQGAMFLDRRVGTVENTDPSAKENFLIVASSVFKKWREGEPPATAHRYFG
jgi:hypothetical protein